MVRGEDVQVKGAKSIWLVFFSLIRNRIWIRLSPNSVNLRIKFAVELAPDPNDATTPATLQQTENTFADTNFIRPRHTWPFRPWIRRLHTISNNDMKPRRSRFVRLNAICEMTDCSCNICFSALIYVCINRGSAYFIRVVCWLT